MTSNEEAALAELVWELSAPHTQEDIAAHLGCSERHVRRIEARALEKLKSMCDADWREDWKGAPLGQRAIDGIPTDGMTRRWDERETGGIDD